MKQTHIGVYGILIKNESVLLIQKEKNNKNR